MISLKAFVSAIHSAVCAAADSLMDKNQELLYRYFEDSIYSVDTEQKDDESYNFERHLTPRMVKLEYPNHSNATLNDSSSVMVPLITLVPFTQNKIEKVSITTEFKMSVNENDELMLDFSKPKRWENNSHIGKLEIVLSPTDTPDGLQQIIEGYDMMLKRQI